MSAHSARQDTFENGAVIEAPLNRLKTSPRNARRTPHGEAAIEALAASIAAKGLLQALVVEPEVAADGAATGAFLVTIGEGRRRALRLLAKRGKIAKTHPVRCVVDTANDAFEISLDENVTRTDMHPADQFEAFRTLAECRGLGAGEIAARFGVSAQVVRQRLRLGAVSPTLMQVYRDGGLNLDQLMAFCVSEDHARQEQVFEQLTWNRSPCLIRRAMTETKLPVCDRRAVFIGAEAYGQAGGTILRDLFTEDGGGWFEDVALIERLALEKLDALAREVREAEGWAWAEARLDYPHGHGLRRAYPHPVERTDAEQVRIAALGDEHEALSQRWDGAEDLPGDVEARLSDIEAELRALGEAQAYAPDDVARGGVFVILGHDGVARIERGLIRPEDEAVAGADPETGPAATGEAGEGAEASPGPAPPESEGEGDPAAPLPDRLVLDLSAWRTASLRDALAQQPRLALVAVVHAVALRTFYGPDDPPTCLDLRIVSARLDGHAPGIAAGPAERRIAERHAAWASRLPRAASQAWAAVAALDEDALLALLAHCASLSLSALRNPLDRRPAALAHAERLAQATGLDMARDWTPTAPLYLGRVTKGRIIQAVAEAVSQDAAARLEGLRKPEMIEAAEPLLAGTGWLPPPLRTAPATETDGEAGPPLPVAAE